jgi:hypothetical protein
MYTLGGENSQQIIISEEEEKIEFDKIERLAKKCVAAMNGMKEEYVEVERTEERKKSNYVPPPMTTKNKAVAAKKNFNRNYLII